MWWLILALVSSTLILVCFKLFAIFNIDTIQAITTNYFAAFILGLVSISELKITNIQNSEWLYLSILSGILLILVFFVFANSTRNAGIAITSVSSKMSVIIPIILGFIIFKEQINIIKIIGIAITLSAFYLIFKQNEKLNLNRSVLLLPILLFFGNGANDSILKTAEYYFINSEKDLINYLMSAFAVAFFIGFGITFFDCIRKKKGIKAKNIYAGLILGYLNWYSTYFFLKGLTNTNVTFFIPIFNACIVCLGALVGLFFFKEKLGKINILGLFLSIIGIFLIVIGNE